MSARMYKYFLSCKNVHPGAATGGDAGKEAKQIATPMVVFLPTVLLVPYLVIVNFLLHIAGAAAAISFWTALTLLSLWLLIMSPLVFVGSYVAFWFDDGKFRISSTKINQTARTVPSNLPLYIRNPFSFLLG